MLNEIIKQTQLFLSKISKDDRKKKGQFFTSKETAEYMASLFDLDKFSQTISILDPGAGTGILTAAFIERVNNNRIIKKINITCYETDEMVLPILKKNLEYIKMNCNILVDYIIIEDDYLLSQVSDFQGNNQLNIATKKYDAIIGNPPYLRVLKNYPAAVAMPSVVHGAPNLYFLFASMSLFNLMDNGQMIYIIPRSWTSGAYFRAFREYFLTQGKLEHMHLFISRDKVFDQENVLQETMIIKMKKTYKKPQKIIISSTNSCSDFNDIKRIEVKYDDIVFGKELYVLLPTSEEEIDIIRSINKYSNTLPDVGIRMRTGIVVDFRQRKELREKVGEDVVPLFYSQHIKNGIVNHNPSGKKYDWISITKKNLLQKNKNYVFCKRFTAKEEKRRLQCGIYFSLNFLEYKFIGTQNKINYVDKVDGSEMSIHEIYGVYALLNSTIFDMYYRILNGSTQVNSTEVNNIPVPPIDLIVKIGQKICESNDLSTSNCDKVLSEVAYGKIG